MGVLGLSIFKPVFRDVNLTVAFGFALGASLTVFLPGFWVKLDLQGQLLYWFCDSLTAVVTMKPSDKFGSMNVSYVDFVFILVNR